MSIDKTLPLIDYAVLRGQMAKFDSLLETLQALFLEQAPLWIADLDAAFAREDLDAVRRLCHKIKGGAGTLQAKAIVAGAVELSHQVAANDAPAIAESWVQLRYTIEQTIAFVRAHGGCQTR